MSGNPAAPRVQSRSGSPAANRDGTQRSTIVGSKGPHALPEPEQFPSGVVVQDALVNTGFGRRWWTRVSGGSRWVGRRLQAVVDWSF